MPLLSIYIRKHVVSTSFNLDPPTKSSAKIVAMLIKLVLLLAAASSCFAAGNFNRDFDITWGDGRARVLNNGKLLNMSLDSTSGSGVQSKHEYMFGKIDMQLKLVPNNSAGTVTAYFLSSEGPTHDEIDFEFLGNVSGEPYIVHTNIFTQGRGGREQQFYLWFDPTSHFHTYSILWNPNLIIFYVDGIPIRVFNNLESQGVPYPSKQPMRVYSSLWNADSWATRDGLDKIDWTQAPFKASLRKFKAQACVWKSKKSSCIRSHRTKTPRFMSQELDSSSEAALKLVRQNYMIYDYCSDTKRFVYGLPLECTAGKINGRQVS